MIVVLALAVLGAATAAAQTTVSVNPSGRATAREAIHLSDVAAIDGPEAERLGSIVVVAPDQAKPVTAGGRLDVDVARIRAAMDKDGVNWGKVTLRGSTCSVKLVQDEPAPKAAPAPRPAAPGAPEPVNMNGAPTVRTHVAARLARLFNVEPADLKIKFRPEDDLLLTTPTSARRVDAQPGASGSSSRMPVQVFVYSGDRVVAAGTVTVEVLVRREVLTAAGPIERGQAIGPEMVTSAVQWVEPNSKVPAGAARVVGSVAKCRINAGSVLTEGDVEPPLAAKRGDVVWVHCLSGAVTVKAKARTLTDARDGEVVQLHMEGSKKTFTARMSGAGLAVMDLGAGL